MDLQNQSDQNYMRKLARYRWVLAREQPWHRTEPYLIKVMQSLVRINAVRNMYHPYESKSNAKAASHNGFTVFSFNDCAQIYVKCTHLSKSRVINLHKGRNDMCCCHVNPTCQILISSNGVDKETLVKVSAINDSKQTFVLYSAVSNQSRQEVCSLQNLCKAKLNAENGYDLIKPGEVPSSILNNMPEIHTHCIVPFCLLTTLRVCSNTCPLKDHTCDLNSNKKFQFKFSRQIDETPKGGRVFPKFNCCHSTDAVNTSNIPFLFEP